MFYRNIYCELVRSWAESDWWRFRMQPVAIGAYKGKLRPIIFHLTNDALRLGYERLTDAGKG